MSEDLTNRTMIGLSPFRPDDEPAEAPPEPPVERATGDAPVVAPVSLTDDDGWDLPEVPSLPPAAPAAAAPFAPAAPPAVPMDDEAASLRGGTMMLSALAFQEALAAADAKEPTARKPQPTLPEAPSAPAPEPLRAGTVRLNAVDFERLMTTGSRPTSIDDTSEAEIAKHALGADDLTDARLAMPSRPVSPSAPAAPSNAPSVAERVADRRAAESARLPPARTQDGNRAMVWVVAGGLCAILVLAAVLVWLFVLNG